MSELELLENLVVNVGRGIGYDINVGVGVSVGVSDDSVEVGVSPVISCGGG